jgi:hypothetical protein
MGLVIAGHTARSTVIAIIKAANVAIKICDGQKWMSLLDSLYQDYYETRIALQATDASRTSAIQMQFLKNYFDFKYYNCLIALYNRICIVSFIVCVVLCAVFCLSVVCYFV